MSSLLPLLLLLPGVDPAPELGQGPNTWVKRSPLAGGPPSPSLGYEGSLVWDAKNRRAIRFAGHNQSGGGEQNAETWSFDPIAAKWELKEPNTSPPGACCNQQNVFDLHQNGSCVSLHSAEVMGGSGSARFTSATAWSGITTSAQTPGATGGPHPLHAYHLCVVRLGTAIIKWS